MLGTQMAKMHHSGQVCLKYGGLKIMGKYQTREPQTVHI